MKKKKEKKQKHFFVEDDRILNYEDNNKKDRTKYQKQWYLKNKKKRLKQSKNYYRKHKERYKELRRKWWEKNKSSLKEIRRENQKKYSKRLSQRKKENLDLRRRYTKATNSWRKYKPISCFLCKSNDNLQLHHYTEIYDIDKVIPLCKDCHLMVHNKKIKFDNKDCDNAFKNKCIIKEWKKKQ